MIHKKGWRKYNLVGQRFASWTVQYEAEPYQNKTNSYTRRRWHCKCDCGNEEDVIEQNLISNISTCCKKCRTLKHAKKVEIGKIYGSLKVISEVEEQDPNLLDSDKLWWCECQCGWKTKKKYSGQYLTNEHNIRRCGKIGCGKDDVIVKDKQIIARKCKTCGVLKDISEFRELAKKRNAGPQSCLKCDPYKEIDIKRSQQLINYSIYKQRAQKKGLPFEITKDEFINFSDQDCIYCGQRSVTDDGKEKGYVGIDRVDSKKGYVKGNMVPCCNVCNEMKMQRNWEVWLENMERVVDRKDKIRQYYIDWGIEGIDGEEGQ